MSQGPFSRRIPSLFWKCVALSLSTHLLFVFFIYKQPLWVAKWLSPFAHLIPQKTITYEPKEELFEGIFDELIVVSTPKKRGFDAPSPPNLEKQLPILENLVHLKEPFSIPFSPSFSFVDEQTEGFILREPSADVPIAFSSPEIATPSLPLERTFLSVVDLPALLINKAKREEGITEARKASQETVETLSVPPLEPSVAASGATFLLYSPKATEEEVPKPFGTQLIKSEQPAAPLHDPSSATKKPLRLVQTYGLPYWEKRENWNDFFNIDVCVMPRKEQEGLYFAVTLNPKAEALTKTIKQRFHFIIDASKYTEKHRLTVYKNAVERALSYLQEGQSFNIYIVDHDTHALSISCLDVSKKSLAQARCFLEKPSFKECAAKGSLLSLLKEIGDQSSAIASIETFDTVLFITDGSFLKHKTTGITAFKKWLKAGTPSFLFYIATVGSDPHEPVLDAIASASGGKVLHSMTHSAFPRKFAKLLIDLKAPIITNLVPRLTCKDKDLAISLMGTCCKTPPLFASQPTTFFGVATSPSSFSLSLDGWNQANPVELTLDIDLKTCRQGTLFMKQIALQDKGEHELSLYLENGIEAHFDQALEWMEEASQPLKR